MEILRAIMEWLNRPITDESFPVYWVNGLAGIGKSTIARTVAKQAKVPMASFFFVRQHDELSNANLFVASIAWAVAEKFPDFMKSVIHALQDDGLLPSKSLDTQFTALFFEPLQNLTVTRPLLLVVDALDECEPKGAQTILNIILSHCTKIPALRILITSRPENHITSIFNKANNLRKVILHEIDNAVIAHDIQHYLEHQLKYIREQDEFPNIPPSWPSPFDLQVLVLRAGKLFIWAATAVKFIGDTYILDPERQLQIILNSSMSSQKPYAELDEMYRVVLSNGIPNLDRLPEFQLVLGTVVLLRNPMSLQNLSKFVQIRDIHRLLIHVQSVILLPQDPEGRVEIYHPSFYDFITDSSRCDDDRFRVDVAKHERWMALHCLELLTSLCDVVYEIVPWHSLHASVDNLSMKLTAVAGQEI